MPFVKTTAQSKIAKLRKRVRVVQGGTSSSKTYTILPLLIQYAIKNPYSEISVVAESIPHLRRGAMKDFIKIMIDTGNYQDANFNKSNLKYTFTNGSYIEFFSADQPDRLRGARRDVLFVNECNNITFEAYHQLAVRTKKFIYLDYNPSYEFWVHTELINDSDTDFIILTYKDNEALDEAIVKEIEKAKEKAKTSSYWDNWWNVYGLGQLGQIQETIYKDWKTIDLVPSEAKLIGGGLDFGYTNDPTAAVIVYKYEDKYIVDEVLYRNGLSNREIAMELKKYNCRFVADSAEPKSIAELISYGLMITPANKGKDSVYFGIQLLQRENIYITNSSTNLIREKRMYCFEKDRSGNLTNQPIDNYNHLMDALRYFALHNLQNNKSGFKLINK